MICHKTLLVGIGGAGRCYLESYPAIQEVARFYVNSDQESLSQCVNGLKLWVAIDVENPNHRLSEQTQNEIRAVFNEVDRLVLIAGLGGVAGSSLLPKLLCIADDLEIPANTVCFIPFSFEDKRRLKALSMIDDWRLSGRCLHTIDLDEVAEQAGESSPLEDVLSEAHLLARTAITEVMLAK